MIHDEINHYIRRHIITMLTYNKTARYRDMRPEHVDSNLYNYHRKELLRLGYIAKNDNEYYLAPKGLRYAELSSVKDLKPRTMPKIVIALVIEDDNGRIACWPKPVQPFIGTYMVPNTKVRFESQSIHAEMTRLAHDIGISARSMHFRGICELVATKGGEQIVHTMFHVFHKSSSKLPTHAHVEWVDIAACDNVAPGLTSIISLTRDEMIRYVVHHHKS